MGQNIMIYSPTWDKLITVEQSKLQGGGGDRQAEHCG